MKMEFLMFKQDKCDKWYCKLFVFFIFSCIEGSIPASDYYICLNIQCVHFYIGILLKKKKSDKWEICFRESESNGYVLKMIKSYAVLELFQKIKMADQIIFKQWLNGKFDILQNARFLRHKNIFVKKKIQMVFCF